MIAVGVGELGMEMLAEGRVGYGEETPTETAIRSLRWRCWHPTPWQHVIHGETEEYRARVVEELIREGKNRGAESFALCGCGDRVFTVRGEHRMVPRRCGKRLCPRCSSWRGGKFVRKVFEYLRGGEREALWHVVVTQPVVEGEGLLEARVRLYEKWRKCGGAKRVGLIGGLVTEHAKWSRRGGWHVHYHVLCEAASVKEFAERWRAVAFNGEGRPCNGPFVRQLCGAGYREYEAEGEEQDFWAEDRDGVARGVQYAVRDVCARVAVDAVGGIPEAEFRSFVRLSTCTKQHRLFGAWRGRPEEEEALEDASDAEARVAVGEGETVELGTVDNILFGRCCSRVQQHEVRAWLLELSLRNQSQMSKRLNRLMEGIGV